MQKLVVVSYTLCAHVEIPKTFVSLGPAPGNALLPASVIAPNFGDGVADL